MRYAWLRVMYAVVAIGSSTFRSACGMNRIAPPFFCACTRGACSVLAAAAATAPAMNPRRLSPRMIYFFSAATAASAAWKPTLLCVPSQYGLVTDPPQRHSAMRGPRALVSTLAPFTSMSSQSPSTRYGPFGRIVILVGIESLLLGVEVAVNDSTACSVPWAHDQRRRDPSRRLLRARAPALV